MKVLFLIPLSIICTVLYPQKAKKPDNAVLDFKNLFSSSMKNDVACFRIPALATAPNGDLIAAIDERVASCGDLKWNNNINIVVRRSIDNGDSWSAIETVVDYPLGKSASDPSMIVDKITGEIILFFNYMDLENEKDVYYLKMTKSSDNGKTWSAPEDITSQITKQDWHRDFKFITSGRGMQTREGKLVHTLVNLQKGLFLFESNDHGKNWSLIDTPIEPADESKVVELSDGSWMVNSRVNNLGNRFVHISSDEGKTWKSMPDPSLIDPGCNASIIRYRSRNEEPGTYILLFSNANDKGQRKNMTVKISTDEGKSWSKGKTLYKESAAYSSMTVLSNGDIGIFFERNEYQENVFARFSIRWLTDRR
ncbi:exo-alpha-sialidase [Maribacter algicola]|uniref:Exo-alpha-sialidase n=1 Tax=Meishania litoralis TaxID=3434685 RepID=A0ACC7LS29_9FLAO